MKKPFIKLLKLPKKYFFYDVQTNNFVEINKNIYYYLEALLKDKLLPELEHDDEKIILDMENSGLLKTRKEIEIEHVMTNQLDNILNNELSKLCLQVTQNCNLRCDYCVFSGSYTGRVHNNKRMSWDIAKKAIDYLAAHSGKSREEVWIGFYGGEPLLEMELIKKCVTYSNKVLQNKKIIYNITTNGTLLTPDVIEFLISNHFIITISIDGPEKIHDINRRQINGNGSFRIIMKNLQNIISIDPSFAFENILINGVLTERADLKTILDFYSGTELNHFSYQISSQNEANLKSKIEKRNKRNVETSKYEIFKMFLYGIGRIPIGMTSHFSESYVKLITENFYERATGERNSNKAHPGGPCVPGQHKLFVNVDGYFYPCERVNEISSIMKMGDVINGINVEAAKKILNIAKTTEEQCKKCWAFDFCTQCIAVADGGDKISASKRMELCSEVRSDIEIMMKDYIVLCNYNCEFEKFKGFKI